MASARQAWRAAQPDLDQARLVFGDALRTDLAAAQNPGIDALFIAGGIHKHDAMLDGAIDPARLAGLFTPGAPPALAAMPQLVW